MIAVTGASGQIGSELVNELRTRLSQDHVLAIWNKSPLPNFINTGPNVQVDVTNLEALKTVVVGYKVSIIYHLATIKSITGEKDPMACWEINTRSLLNVLTLAKELNLEKIFWASSIAAFGPSTPKLLAPQQCYMDPVSMYGVTKVAGELLCQYYHQKFHVDVRALRYVGTLTAESLPVGGTSDFALEMFHWAISHPSEPYHCFLRKDTKLPWMHMRDAIKAAIDLMSAPADKIKVRTAYNIMSVSFTIEELEECIRRKYPNFRVEYNSGDDTRQKIADSVPDMLDDSKAVEDWNWKPMLDLEGIAAVMFQRIREISPLKS